jgi:hypothetical protein
MTKAAAEKPAKEPKAPKGPTVGDVAIEAIRAGKTNEETLAVVKAKFPEAKTKLASINWYRNKLRSEGEKVPTAREQKAKAKAAAGDALNS